MKVSEGREIVLAALLLSSLLLSSLLPSSALATYSLIAVDPARGEVGAAGASCVPYEVIRIYESASGRGALVAQANFDDDAQAQGLALLEADALAVDVLAALTDIGAHPLAPKMQYGVVDVFGGVATVTGSDALAVATDQQRSVGDLRAAALGNVLTSQKALQQALDGFEDSGCDLAERLMVGLEAADDGGEGDSRCTSEGRPANSAFLDVTGPEGTLVRISIPDVSPGSPIPALRSELELWRSEHPCPQPLGGAGGSSGYGGAGTAGSGAVPSDDGCSCHSAPPEPLSSTGWLFALSLAGATARSRWPRRQRGQS